MCGARITALLLLVGLLAPPADAQIEAGDSFTGTIVEVFDGDTYAVWRTATDTVTVYLWGVDAPEPEQTYGTATTRAVRHFIEGKSVRVSVQFVDPKDRIVARIDMRGQDLSTVLLRRGFGWHYELHAPNDTTFARLERQARTAKRGLWSQSSPTPPWKWRERH